MKLAEPLSAVILTEIVMALLPSLFTPLTVILFLAKSAPLIVTALPAVAKVARLPVAVLMKPEIGVQAGVETVQP